MNRIVECIPNFSEGRSRAVVQALVEAVASVPQVLVLDRTMDRDHHRSVLTFAGEPAAVAEAAFRALSVATEQIDLRRHRGVHPRVGATDVVPFVPIKGVTMRDCVRLAQRLGRRVGRELNIPVFLYAQAASSHRHRAPLEAVRRGGLGGLAARMASDDRWRPDFGPRRLHRTAGAVAIGARPPLVAFNVNLRSRDLDIARSIAKAVRQSDGGVPHLKAIGVELASRKMVQVAMNLTDYRVTPPHVAFEAVQVQAALAGVDIAGSEIIGLVPREALVAAAEDRLRLEGFDRTRILESRIEALERADNRPAFMPADLRGSSLSQVLEAVAAPTPIPAGAAVAGLVGAFAASLGIMAARLSAQPTAEQRLARLSRTLIGLAQADGAAYRKFREASRLAPSTPNRSAAVALSLHRATEVPHSIAERAVEVTVLLGRVLKQARPPVQPDLRVAVFFAQAAAKAGVHTAQENLKSQTNQRLKNLIHRRIQRTAFRLEEQVGLCYTPPPSQAVTQVGPLQAWPGKARKRKEWKSRSSITTSKKR